MVAARELIPPLLSHFLNNGDNRGGFRHVQHVRPNRGRHKKGASQKQFASERLASNCQTAAAAIVVCIAARVLNKMSTMITVRSGEGSRGYSYNRGPTFFSEQGPH